MTTIAFWQRGHAPEGMPAGLAAVTPDDDNDLPEKQGFGLSTVDGGDITFTDILGVTHTITFAANGGVNCGIKRVLATGTTATEIYVGVLA